MCFTWLSLSLGADNLVGDLVERLLADSADLAATALVLLYQLELLQLLEHMSDDTSRAIRVVLAADSLLVLGSETGLESSDTGAWVKVDLSCNSSCAQEK